jgi:hypothetical protein
MYVAGMYSLDAKGHKKIDSATVAKPSFGIHLNRTVLQKTNFSIPGNIQEWPLSLITPSTMISYAACESVLGNLESEKIFNLTVKGSDSAPYLWGLSQFTDLKALNLQKITLSNFAFCQKMQQLKTLVLSRVNILSQELTFLPNLTDLRIDSCQSLRDLNVISKLDQLKIFVLEGNSAITKLPILPASIQVIKISEQKLVNNWDSAFSKLNQLKTIELILNNMNLIPGMISNQSNLECLNLEEPELPQSEINKLAILKQRHPLIDIKPEELNERIS